MSLSTFRLEISPNFDVIELVGGDIEFVDRI